MIPYEKLLTSASYPETYLEIGCCEGGSLLAVVRAFPGLRSVTICDTWGDEFGGTGRGNHDHIEKALDSVDYNGQRYWLDGRSQDLLPQMIGYVRNFDLIGVDGDHTYSGAFVDLLIAWELLVPGGRLVFDDIDHPLHSHLGTVAEKFRRCKERQIAMEDKIPGSGKPGEPSGAVMWQKNFVA